MTKRTDLKPKIQPTDNESYVCESHRSGVRYRTPAVHLWTMGQNCYFFSVDPGSLLIVTMSEFRLASLSIFPVDAPFCLIETNPGKEDGLVCTHFLFQHLRSNLIDAQFHQFGHEKRYDSNHTDYTAQYDKGEGDANRVG